MLKLRPFQTRAVRALECGRYDVVCLSLPRSQGKSSLAAELCYRALTPGDMLYRKGTESHLVASTIGQSRKTCFKLLRKLVEAADPDGKAFKISESANACHVRRRACNTRVSVVAPSAKATLGLVGCPLVIVDEPGSYDIDGGAALWDSLTTALGKPDSELRLFVIGHLAPKATAAGHWFFDLVARGSHGRTWVYAVQGDPAKWDRASEIRRCSPLSWSFPKSRAKLFEQRDAARSDSQARAAFLSYRLNLPTRDEASMLLTVDAWERVLARPVPPRDGRPVVGVDMGENRAWSAAVALWPSGRCEALAVAPGIPSMEAQEKRDRVPRGTYRALVDAEALRVASGRRIPPAEMVAETVRSWSPVLIVADRRRINDLLDVGLRVQPRVTRWFDAAADIRALRGMALDCDLAVEHRSRGLLTASLSAATVLADGEGSMRLIKRGTNNQARDDVAAALTLAAGANARRPRRRSVKFRVVGAA